MLDLWNPPPARLTLATGEVHVWRASLDLPEPRVESLAQHLAPEDVERAGRFYFERDRKHFTVARGVLRAILGLYLDLPPARLVFHYNAYGKPFLPDQPLRFNLSHSGELALYAVSAQRELGVDVERIRTDFQWEEIAEKFFSPRERMSLRALPTPLKYLAFFNCWTRKEAFIKALGEGVSFPLDQFDVSLSPDEPARLLSVKGDARAAARWCLHDLTVGKDYAAACVVEGANGRLQFWQWPEQLEG